MWYKSAIEAFESLMTKPAKISVVLSTYNSPAYLEKALVALSAQTEQAYEVVVADDGSNDATRDVIERLTSSFSVPLVHAWQEDRGFRAAASRNEAVRKSTGDYLVFLDGDCLARSSFIQAHRQFAEAGYFVRGSRIMLREAFSKRIFAGQAVVPETAWQWLLCKLQGDVKRIGSLLPLPLRFTAYRKRGAWYGVKTCNLGVWRQDFEAVNGFDERYVGWGHEDADLAVRLLRQGVARKEGRASIPVIHLWHTESSRDQLSDNVERLQTVLAADYCRVQDGLTKETLSK